MSTTTLVDKIDSNKLYADRAEKDKNGYDIADTYANKASLSAVATTGEYYDLKNYPAIQVPLVDSDVIQTAYDKLFLYLVEDGSGQNISGLKVEDTVYQGGTGTGATYTDANGNTRTYFKFDSLNMVASTTLQFKASGGSYSGAYVFPYFIQGTQISDVTSGSAYSYSDNSFYDGSMYDTYGGVINTDYIQGSVDFSQPFLVVFVDDYSNNPKHTTDYCVTEYSSDSLTLSYTELPVVSSHGLKVNAAQVKQQMNLATVASSGSYSDLSNKPTIPTVPTAGNMLSTTNNVLNVTTTAGITDIQLVQQMPATPVATVLYLIPEN